MGDRYVFIAIYLFFFLKNTIYHFLQYWFCADEFLKFFLTGKLPVLQS